MQWQYQAEIVAHSICCKTLLWWTSLTSVAVVSEGHYRWSTFINNCHRYHWCSSFLQYTLISDYSNVSSTLLYTATIWYCLCIIIIILSACKTIVIPLHCPYLDNLLLHPSFLLLQDAMEVLGMGEDERLAMFRVVAGILHFGNIEVKQRPREEWATIPTTTGQLETTITINMHRTLL